MHIAGGEQTFILRTRGRQNEGELTRTSAWPGFGKLREIVEGTGDELIAIAEQLDDDVEVRLLYMDKSYRYPTSLLLVHAMEHGVEHRTEVKVALAQRGLASRDLDGWAYAAAAGYGQAVP